SLGDKAAQLVAERSLAQAEIEDTATLRLGRPGELRDTLTIPRQPLRGLRRVLEQLEVWDESELVQRTSIGLWVAAIDLAGQKEAHHRHGVGKRPRRLTRAKPT